MASPGCKMALDDLRKQVIKSAIKAPESEYDRGIFEAYSELYNEACSVYAYGGSFVELRAGFEAWATAAIISYNAFAEPTDYMRGIRDVGVMLITE